MRDSTNSMNSTNSFEEQIRLENIRFFIQHSTAEELNAACKKYGTARVIGFNSTDGLTPQPH